MEEQRNRHYLDDIIVDLDSRLGKLKVSFVKVAFRPFNISRQLLEEAGLLSEIYQLLQQSMPEEAVAILILTLKFLDVDDKITQRMKQYVKRQISLENYPLFDLVLTLATVFLKLTEDEFAMFKMKAQRKFLQQFHEENLSKPDLLMELYDSAHCPLEQECAISHFACWLKEAGCDMYLQYLRVFCKRHSIPEPESLQSDENQAHSNGLAHDVDPDGQQLQGDSDGDSSDHDSHGDEDDGRLEHQIDGDGDSSDHDNHTDEDNDRSKYIENQYKRPCSKALGGMLICLSIMVLCSAFAIYLFESTTLLSPHILERTLIVRGDLIQLYDEVKSTTMYSYELHFFQTNITDEHLSATKVVEIYQMTCGYLPKLFKSIPIFAQPINMNFDNCSEYDGICILSDFFYQIETNFSALSFTVYTDVFNSETRLRISAFDDLNSFNSYLLSGKLIAVKSVIMNSMPYEFVLTSGEMRRSSYYFIAIENVRGLAKWLTVHQFGVHVFYDRSSHAGRGLIPFCTMNSTNNYKCKTEITSREELCYLAYFEEDQLELFNSPSPNELIYISSMKTDYRRTLKGEALYILSIVLGLIAFISGLLFPLLIYLFIYYANGYLSTCRYTHRRDYERIN